MRALSGIAAIAALRAGPQDLPASTRLLAAVLIVDLVISMIGLSGVMPVTNALVVAALSAGLGIVFTYLVLYLRGVAGRFWQTATALFGTDAFISLIALPLSLALAKYLNPEGEATIPPVLALALLTVLAWNVAVVAKIFSNALDQPSIGGFVVGLAYVFLTTGIAF